MMQTPDKVLAEAAGAQDGEARAREARGNSVPRHREAGPGVWEVRAGCIGRGYAGKTALFRAMSEGPIGDFFPSGLHVDVGDPREVAQMIREAEETQRILQMSGLPPTLEVSQIRYYLYDGDDQRVVYKMREVIGQVLTHTLPNSAQEQQARYDEYLKSLLNTHVLWAVIPCCPPKPTARDRRRYANDLRITGAYLREALRLRPSDQPVAVALVISKIDTLFQDADEARTALSDDVLRGALGPLVNTVDRSTRATDGVIIPVTAFGFGNAVLRQGEGQGDETPPPTGADPFGAEPVWLLRDGEAPRPFNLDTLLIWTLLLGLLNQDRHNAPEQASETAGICRMLREDLEGEDRWFLPLKGRLLQGQ
jgi:hypothetical protein